MTYVTAGTGASRYPVSMSLEQALREFYAHHGFGETPGRRPKTVPVYTGCMLVPLPNIETRNRYLKYHDLHHLVTGYSVGRIGEGQVSAWELGSGSMRTSPMLGFMNLVALSTGWVLDREKMWVAYERGLRSYNLYGKDQRRDVDKGRWDSVDALRRDVLEVRGDQPLNAWRRGLFRSFIGISLVIHATIAIPAMIVRTVSDLRHGKSLTETFSPVPRSDLF